MIQRRVISLSLLLLALILHESSFAQLRGGRRPQQVQRTSVVLLFGITNPQSHGRLREFWLNGPSGSAEFRVHLSPLWSLGAGGDMSLLYFDEAAFTQRWPGVPLQKKQNLFLGNIFLDAAYTPFPASRLRPYVKGQLGAEFISEAIYRQVIAGVRYTYYNVGGRTRLTLGAVAGALYALDYNFSLVAELKATYVHNDPAVGLLLHGRGGIQYKF